MARVRYFQCVAVVLVCLFVLAKVNSVQEACAKCFAVHISKFEILQTTWKSKTKIIKMLKLLMKNGKFRVWCSLFHFIHVICKISNFNMWTAKHLVQASVTELTLNAISLILESPEPPSLRFIIVFLWCSWLALLSQLCIIWQSPFASPSSPKKEN